ncbi:MAG: hypothetical protein CL420_05115 [Acidimicrobiaceae bacterium]|jgi:uncharacterized membrane protein YphA (DoxX/SURF4 family)|nr:hypothetical protein [Acidimicrobiaceae bacterium]|tara:strand:+ start:2557 stop:2916 length:360 start_codon:yes stop_codon:yes gene_type:complete
METIGLLAQIGAGLWILNVWILRFNKETDFRGGDAKNMLEEFQTYGISSPFMYLIGGTKVTLAILLIVGVWVESLTRPSAILLGLLMVGAITMHLRVGDHIKKAAPAISVLSLSILALI